MESGKSGIGKFIWRTTALHMIAYYVAGMLAFVFMNYRGLFGSGALAGFMRPVDDPIVALGPLLQVIMGIALALILYPFREVFLERKRGWLRLLLLIGGLSIFAPQIPGPGTFEGLIYTKLSLADHLAGLPETITYSLLFSAFLPLWHSKPKKLWNALAGIALGLIALTCLLGYLASQGIIKS
jgi:hypothetical protein